MIKMKTFGTIKTKILNSITESYSKNKKDDVKKLINLIKENKNIKQLYLLYEDVENKYIKNEEVAKIYVDELSDFLSGKKNNITKELKKLVENTDNITIPEIYTYLDILSEENNIFNIEKKIEAKINLKNYLLKEKEEKNNDGIFTENYKLLNVVLANEFNNEYGENLSEDDREKFKKIISMSKDELINEVNSLKGELSNKVDQLLKETNDEDLKNKLELTKEAISESKYSKYEFIKLENLKKQLFD